MPSPFLPSRDSTSLTVSDRYQIIRKLGEGGSGTVYLALDSRLQQRVALKVLRARRLEERRAESIGEEFHAFTSLRHPRIARALDFGYTDAGKIPYYTREYVPGTPLSGGLSTISSRTLAEHLRPIFDLLEALEYLHAHDLLHLDIHPGNLIESSDPGRGCVLIDFGWLHSLTPRSSPGRLDPVELLPPEQLAGGPLTPRTDLFAVGLLLGYRLTGQLEAITSSSPLQTGHDPRVDLELERLLSKALQPDPDRRFQSAREMARVLGDVLGLPGQSETAVRARETITGRERDLETFDEKLRALRAGAPFLRVISSDRGLGKSRLLGEIRIRAQLRGLECLHVTFLVEPESEPALVRGLRGLGLSSALFSESRAPADPSARATRIAHELLASRDSGLVLLLDDLDRADPFSLSIVRVLAELLSSTGKSPTPGPALALVATTDARSLKSCLADLPGDSVHSLRRLTRRESRSLLDSLLLSLRITRRQREALVELGDGSPSRLRRAARSLLDEWHRHGAVPSDFEPAESLIAVDATDSPGSLREDPSTWKLLRVLACLGRPARLPELDRISGLPSRAARRTIDRLVAEEIVARRRQGRTLFFHVLDPDLARQVRHEIPDREKTRIHLEACRLLEEEARESAWDLECRARHLIAAGRRTRARPATLAAVEALVKSGRLQNAIRLLREALEAEPVLRWKVQLTELLSDVASRSGAHEVAIANLEDRLDTAPMATAETVRLLRRLGAHHHRDGRAEEAGRCFTRALELARPGRDHREIVQVHGELAELHTLQGEFEAALRVCQEGLALLESRPLEPRSIHRRFEVELRGTLGHLYLRQMRLEEARIELERALDPSRDEPNPEEVGPAVALIRNNLGIVYNQLNRFREARACFRQAERQLERAGEIQEQIQVACNLAIIAAKTGSAAEAREDLGRAGRLLERNPGERFEFNVEIARGLVSLSLGETAGAIQAFGRAAELGESLGDRQFTRFLKVYRAEAEMRQGRYDEARRILRRARREEASAPPVFRRMVRCRLFALECLAGRLRPASRLLRDLDAPGPRGAELLEAWNDLFLALGYLLTDPGEARPCVDRALEVFARLGIPAGERLARLGQAVLRLEPGEARVLRTELQDLETRPRLDHRLLAVLEPVTGARLALNLEDRDRAEALLDEASSALVGQSFLEADWLLESLRARLEIQRGEPALARRYLARSLQAAELLGRSQPESRRTAFSRQARFRSLEELERRLRTFETPVLRSPGERRPRFPDLVIRSRAMQLLVRSLEGLERQELPVLISGEPGSGKEMVARALHHAGARRDRPFFVLSCETIPAELFEAELFGYESGAFTGADQGQVGLLEHNQGGTLLIDEITRISPEAQIKLLRVIESRQVRPLGSHRILPLDLRILSTTSEDPDLAVREGRLREDLYYRIGGARVTVPPLRERRDDLELLVDQLLERHARKLDRPRLHLSPPALHRLAEHEWPGNIRELEMTLLRLMVLHPDASALEEGPVLRCLPEPPPAPRLIHPEAIAGRDLDELRRELDRVYLERLYRDTEGDLSRMQEILNVGRSGLYAWFKRVGLSIQDLRSGRRGD